MQCLRPVHGGKPLLEPRYLRCPKKEQHVRIVLNKRLHRAVCAYEGCPLGFGTAPNRRFLHDTLSYHHPEDFMRELLVIVLIAGQAWCASVRDFKAKDDGSAKDTTAIQAAIEAASQQGGGVVFFPAGAYLSGTIHLKSNAFL